MLLVQKKEPLIRGVLSARSLYEVIYNYALSKVQTVILHRYKYIFFQMGADSRANKCAVLWQVAHRTRTSLLFSLYRHV